VPFKHKRSLTDGVLPMDLSGLHCRVTFLDRDLDEFIEREQMPEERRLGRDGTIFGWDDEEDQHNLRCYRNERLMSLAEIS
jgi:hypothetical protein